MNSYGETLRKIRLNVNLSQQKFCDEIMSQSNYSKIEKGLVEVTFTHLVQLLKKINVKVEEFLWIHENHQDVYSNMDSLIANYSKGEGYLKQLQKRILDNSAPTIYDKEIASIIDAFLLIEKNKWEDAKNTVKHIWQRLENVDTYYYYDLQVLNMILFILPVETAYQLFTLTRRKVLIRSNFRNTHNLIENMHTNIILMLITNKKYQEALEELDEHIPNLIKQNYLLKLAINYIRKGYVTKLLHLKTDKDWIIIGFDMLKYAQKDFDIKQMRYEMEDKLSEGEY